MYEPVTGISLKTCIRENTLKQKVINKNSLDQNFA